MMKLISFIKETCVNAARIVTSKKGLKNLFRISLYRNAVYLMLNSIILAGTGFFFWMIATRLYPTEVVGLASAAISAVGLLALLSTLGLDFGLIRFLPRSGEKATDMINSSFTIAGLVSITLSLIFLAGLGIWSPALLPIREHSIFFVAFFVFTGAVTLDGFTRRAYIASRRADLALVQGLIFGLLRFIPLVLLAGVFSVFGVFASWGIGISLALAPGIFLFLPRIQSGYRPLPHISRHAINEIVRFSFANYVANLLWVIPTLVLPLMVINLLGAEANAYFYIGWAIGNMLFMIPTAMSFSLFAEGSHNEEESSSLVKRSLKLTFFLLIPAMAIIFFRANKVLLLFGTAYSENAVRLLQILVISALPVTVNHIYFSIKRVEKKMKGVVAMNVLIAVIALVLSYFLLLQVGVSGAGIGWLTSHGIVALGIVGGTLLRRRAM